MKELTAKASAILEVAQRQATPAAEVRARVWEQTRLRAAAGDLGPALPETTAVTSAATTKLLGWIAAAVVGGGAIVAGVAMLDQGPEPAAAVVIEREPEGADFEDATPDEVVDKERVAEPVVLPTIDAEPEPKLEPDAVEVESPKRRPVSKPASVDADTSFSEEVELMGRARASLGQGDAARALSLLNEHAKKFPRGVLAPERDVSRIMALCALGRTEKAKQHAATFVRRHPRSALTDRVRRTCVGDDLP